MLSLVPRIPNRLPFPTKGFTLVNGVLSPFVGDSNGDWDLDGSGTNPASTSLVTQSLGSSLLAVVAGDLAASGVATYNGSNMDSIGTSGYASGLWPGFGFDIHYTHAIYGGSHNVQFSKSSATTESTLMAVEIREGGYLASSSLTNVAAPGAGNPVTSGNVTCTEDALLVAFWGGDGGVGLTDQTATPSAGFTTVESLFLGSTAYIQSAAAVRQVPAGTYSVSWTPAQNQGAILFLGAIQRATVPQVIASVFTGGSTGTTASAAIDTTSADALVAVVISQSSTAPTLTDNKGNTWVPEGTTTLFSSGFNGYVSTYKTSGAITVGTNHILTAVGNIATSVGLIAIRSMRGGALTLGTWDKTIDNTSPVTASITPSQNQALIIAVGMHDAGGNPVTYNWTGSNMYVRSQELNADSFWTGSIAIKPVYTAGPHTVSYTYTGGVGSAVTYLAITEAT